MIKQLKRRFIRITVLTLAIAMVLVVAIVNVTNLISVRRELADTLELIADNAMPDMPMDSNPLPDDADGEKGYSRHSDENLSGPGYLRNRLGDRSRHTRNMVLESSWFSAICDENGNVHTLDLAGMADTDEEAAREAIEEYLEWTVAPELNAHLANTELVPVPEGFRLESTGLTLLYKAEQLSTLKDRAGAVKIGWNEIRDIVDWSEDGIPARIGAADMVTLTEESRDKIIAMTESGQLPDIPVKPGDSVKEWTPEEYAGGRMFALEGAAFRDVLLLSDKVSRSWDESRVQGIRMNRGCVWGLCIGETAAAEWHQLLGEPDNTAVLDAEAAELERTVPGKCDYYQYGDYRLQLQYGEDGILAGITLAE